jgi:hypothetical protein
VPALAKCSPLSEQQGLRGPKQYRPELSRRLSDHQIKVSPHHFRSSQSCIYRHSPEMYRYVGKVDLRATEPQVPSWIEIRSRNYSRNVTKAGWPTSEVEKIVIPSGPGLLCESPRRKDAFFPHSKNFRNAGPFPRRFPCLVRVVL